MSATSNTAYQQIRDEGLLSQNKMRVYEIFYTYGKLTGAQAAEIYKSQFPSASHSETVRNRITELVMQGVLDVEGTKVCEQTKREVFIYQLNDRLPQKIEKRKTKTQSIEEALEKIVAAGKASNEVQVKQILREAYGVLKRAISN
jgi:hypothetical protein